MINWRVRAKHPSFWIGLTCAIATPALAYLGIAYEDLTSWEALGAVVIEFVNNPYLIGLAFVSVANFFGASIVDPTTSGISDSQRAISYEEPYKENEQESQNG